MDPKEIAARSAVAAIESGMALGLGSGTTSIRALHVLAARIRNEGLQIVGVPTSSGTEHEARALGIPLATLDERPVLDVAIDGADQVDAQLACIKGYGGALVREKIVARAARRFVVVVDESKRVARLGERHPLPVAVERFGWSTHLDAVRGLGAEPVLRRDAAGRPYATDDGDFILDCRFPDGIADADAVARELKSRPGVIDTGLFLGFSPEVIVGR